MKFNYVLTKNEYLKKVQNEIRKLNYFYYFIVSLIYFSLGSSMTNRYFISFALGFILHFVIMFIIIYFLELLFKKYIIKVNELSLNNVYGNFNFFINKKSVHYNVEGEKNIVEEQIKKTKCLKDKIYIYTINNKFPIELHECFFKEKEKFLKIKLFLKTSDLIEKKK